MSEHAQTLETFADLRRRRPDPDTAGSDAALIAALDAGAAALRRETALRYALRQCFVLALREARKEQAADDSRSSRWNHIKRFCKDADEDGSICASSVLRENESAPPEAG